MSTARAGGGAVEVTGDCGAAGAVVGGEEVCSTAGAPGAAAGEGEVCASTGGAADGDGEACCTAARLTNLNRGLAPPPPIGATLPHPRNKPGPALVKFGRTTPPPPLETTGGDLPEPDVPAPRAPRTRGAFALTTAGGLAAEAFLFTAARLFSSMYLS